MTHILTRMTHPVTDELVMVVLVLDENSNYDIIEHTADFEITEKQLIEAIKYGEYYKPEQDHNNGF